MTSGTPARVAYTRTWTPEHIASSVAKLGQHIRHGGMSVKTSTLLDGHQTYYQQLLVKNPRNGLVYVSAMGLSFYMAHRDLDPDQSPLPYAAAVCDKATGQVHMRPLHTLSAP